MKATFLLDSAILIDHLRGVPEAHRWLSGLQEGMAAISVITRAEVLSIGDPTALAAAAALCGQFACLPITAEVADKAAEMRRQFRWKLPDAFQAALAREQRLQLVTRNSKDFNGKTHPFVHIPYRLETQR